MLKNRKVDKATQDRESLRQGSEDSTVAPAGCRLEVDRERDAESYIFCSPVKFPLTVYLSSHLTAMIDVLHRETEDARPQNGTQGSARAALACFFIQ
jgi:hypothetical protein